MKGLCSFDEPGRYFGRDFGDDCQDDWLKFYRHGDQHYKDQERV